MLTTAALIVGGLACLFLFSPPLKYTTQEFIAAAQIVESIDAQWKDNVSYKKGKEVSLEKLCLLKGTVLLRLKNNVEVVLEGPAEFILRGEGETFCKSGKISVTVPPEGKGFKVETPFAAVIDIGTQFSLAVDDEKIDVHVIKGTVDVARSEPDRFQLTTGLAAMLDSKGKTEQFRANPNTFFSTEAVQQLWNEYFDRRSPVWEAQKLRRSNDPALLASLADVTSQGASRTTGLHPD